MNSNKNITPVKIWILILITITVITLLVFTGIKLFSKNNKMSVNNDPNIYNFVSDVCTVSFDTKSEQFATNKECWEVDGNKFSWYMTCYPTKFDLRQAVEVRVYFLQGVYSHIYAYNLAQKKINYQLKDFSKDLSDNRITECLYQYPMKLPNK